MAALLVLVPWVTITIMQLVLLLALPSHRCWCWWITMAWRGPTQFIERKKKNEGPYHCSCWSVM